MLYQFLQPSQKIIAVSKFKSIIMMDLKNTAALRYQFMSPNKITHLPLRYLF
jgi:hypothetical protein